MTIAFKRIDEDNLDAIIELSDKLTENQKKCVASNLYSIAESTVHPNNAYYRAIYLGEEPIGFFMVYIPDEKSIKKGNDKFFLWRFMIVPEHQGKGYGRVVLDRVREMAKEQKYTKLYTSCGMVEDGPYPFYKKYGFNENGEMLGDETVLEIDVR